MASYLEGSEYIVVCLIKKKRKREKIECWGIANLLSEFFLDVFEEKKKRREKKEGGKKGQDPISWEVD